MSRILLENFDENDIKNLHNDGKKISYLLDDDGEFIFEIPNNKLKIKVDKDKGFRVSEDDIDNIVFEDYTDIYEDDNGKKYAKCGDNDNRTRDGHKIITSIEFDAYVSEFGINKFKLKKNINVIKINGKDVDNG